MEIFRGVNILLLEHSNVDEIRDYFQKVFERLNYKCKFHGHSKATKIDGNDSIFNLNIIDVVICDVSLGNIDNALGLNLMKRIKNLYPEVLVIANSGFEWDSTVLFSSVPPFDLFVDKRNMLDGDYFKYVSYKIGLLFKRNTNVILDVDNSNLDKRYTKTTGLIKLNHILRSITFTSQDAQERTFVSQVQLEALQGGYSKSDVFRMTSFTDAGLKCVNSILKISPKNMAIQEINNYYNYVKWFLPYTWRPEIIGTFFNKEDGAICYSFAYNDEVPYQSVTHHLSNCKWDRVRLAIDHIFDPSHQRWYHVSNIVDVNGSLQKYYFEKFAINRGFLVTKLKTILEDVGKFKRDHVMINGLRIPEPARFLLSPGYMKQYKTCICHGDLNTNNILVSEDNQLVFIDFQDTGRGHVFEDFTVFEGCLRLYSRQDMEFSEILQNEINIIEGTESALVYSESSQIIRNYAFTNFSSEPTTNYYFSFAMCLLRLLRIDNLEQWQKNQIVASMLASVLHMSRTDTTIHA